MRTRFCSRFGARPRAAPVVTPECPGRADTPLETAAIEPRDPQQLVAFEMLCRAGGAPVSYAELHAAGIEFPASVVAELELARVTVERRDVHAPGARRLRGVRLDPNREPPGGLTAEQRPVEQTPLPVRPWAPPEASGRALSGRTTPRWVAGAAAVAAAIAVAVAALSPGHPPSHGAAQTHPPVRLRASRPARAAPRRGRAPARASTHHRTSRPPPTAPAPASRPLQALAFTLDLRGHGLLESGRHDKAIPVLQQALSDTGEHVPGCLEPASAACLTYAYALFDLGRALRLSGHPRASVPILRNRLQIDNQRPVVALELARAEAATTIASPRRGSPRPVV